VEAHGDDGQAAASRSKLTAELTDAALVARCRAGDDEAWRELVERFSRYVYAIAIQGFRLPTHDAEDVFQDVFARTFEHLDELRDDSAVRPWIATLTRRLCVDKLRSGGREHLVEEPLEDAGADDGLAELDEAMAVHEAMKTLPEHCAEILDRFFTRDESYRTIGDALDLPPGTIASRISRCLSKLRGQLEGRKPRFPPSIDR
jgi:RNA polymerase sigma factor (sigma-70 family)